MKYKIELAKKGLKKEDLPNSKQKEIEKLLTLENEEDINKLDNSLSIFIISFDVEKHKAKLQNLANMRKKRENGGIKSQEQEVQQVEVQVQDEQKVYREEQKVERLRKSIRQDAEMLRQDAERTHNQSVAQAPPEEFEKIGENGKGNNLVGIMIGITAFVLTLGAFNYFKGRR